MLFHLVHTPSRRLPPCLHGKVKAELDAMEAQDVIKKIIVHRFMTDEGTDLRKKNL